MAEAQSGVLASATRKAAWRLLPFMALLYFVSFLDRVNVGYAALTMNADIGLSASAYGFGAGIFFLGYFLFEVPSNLILERIGARRWIARIMITWGVLSAATAFVTGPVSFYVVRFLLGVAEAGFFPGMILYLTYWFPGSLRARIVGGFMVAIPLSNVIGAPLSTALLETSIFGLRGWQTMFLLEALPAVVLGVVVLFWLTDRPSEATWLTAEERAALDGAVQADHTGGHLQGLRQGLLSPRVWLLALVYFCLVFGLYGLGFWAPQIIRAAGDLSVRDTGLLTAVPYLAAAVAMVLWGRRSDRTGERARSVSIAALAAAAGFAGAAYAGNVQLGVLALTLAAVGVFSALPVFWTLPTSFLSGSAAAGGIALVNSVGNLAGHFGPWIIGTLREGTGGYREALLVQGGVLLAAALLAPLAAGRASQAALADSIKVNKA